MATQKPSKPSVSLPDNFGGVKTAYTTTQIENGYQDGVPEVVDGGNINYEKDGIFQKLKYIEAIADVINNIPANRYLSVDSNNRFEYYDASTRNSYGNIGDIKYSMRTEVPYGGAWCDGTMYTKTQLPDLYDMLVNGDLQTVAISEYESQISSNGVCGFFGLDTSNERFKVPTLKDIYIKAGQTPSVFGAESLPNITGSLTNDYSSFASASGAFGISNQTNVYASGNIISGNRILSIDASRSSSTYQDNAKVNPDHIVYRAYVVVFTAVEDSTKATWNLKEDKSNKVQDLTSPSETTYPSTQAIINSLAQNLNSPSATTFPSTQAVANESSRIISIMNNAILDTLNGGFWLQTSNGVKILIQFGYFVSTSTSSEKTVTWPVAFPSHLDNVLTLPYAPSGQNFNINVKKATLSDCAFRTVDGNGYGINISFYWFAVGH